jgi:hypothetical protein
MLQDSFLPGRENRWEGNGEMFRSDIIESADHTLTKPSGLKEGYPGKPCPEWPGRPQEDPLNFLTGYTQPNLRQDAEGQDQDAREHCARFVTIGQAAADVVE